MYLCKISNDEGTASWISQAFIVIIDIAHYESIGAVLKSHAVFSINIGFKHTRGALHRVTAQAGMTKISIQKYQRLINLLLY